MLVFNQELQFGDGLQVTRSNVYNSLYCGRSAYGWMWPCLEAEICFHCIFSVAVYHATRSTESYERNVIVSPLHTIRSSHVERCPYF